MEALESILSQRLIAIIRGLPTEMTLQVAEALYKGGIRLLEVPFNHINDAEGLRGAENIRVLNKAFQGRALIGAGTVVTKQLVDRAAEAGASYIISPNTNVDLIRHTKALGLVSMPGAMTPSEILTAYEAGADLVKVFPAGTLGPAYIKAVRAPLSQVPLVAVGGVGVENAGDFLTVGCVAVACGGKLCDAAVICEGRYEALTEAAEQFVAAVQSVG